MPEEHPQKKKQEMLTILLKTAVGVAVFLALLFCGVFGYIAWSKSKYRRLKDTHDLRQRIQSYGEDYMSKRPHAALAIGVIQKGTTETFFFGQLSQENATKPDADTVFEIGSISKVYTALATQALVGEGKLKWDDSVRDVLPEDVTLVPVFEQIKLSHLATHRSGLPRLPDNLEVEDIDVDNPYKEYGSDSLYAFLGAYEARIPPGKKMEYSNLGFGLLGHVGELVSGRTYGDLLAEKIFGPLGMTNSGVSVPATKNLAVGHSPEGDEVQYWDFQVLGGAGVVKSTLGDQLRFLAANLNPTNSPIAEVLEECQQKHGESWMGDVGYGWQLTSTLQGELDFVWHNGGTGGFVSFAGFDRKHGNAVVMLSSSGDAMKGDFYLDTLAMEILKLAAKISLD